ncbi:hypothetical protein, partial [Paracoccus saliphilus]|uniref:hypothetical protein n=1 Tax=Paracoccus saliphilus TaxID=405559 RepID=UPI0026576241
MNHGLRPADGIITAFVLAQSEYMGKSPDPGADHQNVGRYSAAPLGIAAEICQMPPRIRNEFIAMTT